MKKPRHNPSPALLEDLVRRYEAGETTTELGACLGIDPETIRLWLKKQGAVMRPRGWKPVPVPPEVWGTPLDPSGNNRNRIRDTDGYILVRVPGHPQANSGGYVREHRLVMERELGRPLLAEEVVHHRNGTKDDNRPENLRLYASHSEHFSEELHGNQHKAGKPSHYARVHRSREAILAELRALYERLGRPLRRVDLMPPAPSYKTVTKVFGDWRTGVEIATGSRPE